MAGLVPAIHAAKRYGGASSGDEKPKSPCNGTAWMAGTSPAMTAAPVVPTLLLIA